MVVGLLGRDIKSEPAPESIGHIFEVHGELVEALTRHGRSPFIDGSRRLRSRAGGQRNTIDAHFLPKVKSSRQGGDPARSKGSDKG
ncbi:hypothetical protein [Micromonospora sp. NBC_00860]|uniref:hypothetical protein n=1 Tax=Micromonospora sp. NBC_00860 TaxID=2975980 RepID=UPI0038685127|nr:hypothetical protein OH804_04400 [Micromonospora sp. NBC_00860]